MKVRGIHMSNFNMILVFVKRLKYGICTCTRLKTAKDIRLMFFDMYLVKLCFVWLLDVFNDFICCNAF